MALTLDCVRKGVAIKGAYIRVWTFEGTKDRVTVTVAYQSAQGAEVFDTERFVVPLNLEGPNVIAQIYAYLQTLPDFAGAADC